jgi:hypothetical protein
MLARISYSHNHLNDTHISRPLPIVGGSMTLALTLVRAGWKSRLDPYRCSGGVETFSRARLWPPFYLILTCALRLFDATTYLVHRGKPR